MARFMGGTQGTFGSTIVSGGPYADTADPTVNVLWLGQAGIGLPERDYYLNDSFKPQRDAYRAYIARTMKMAGHADPEKAAEAIIDRKSVVKGKSVSVRVDLGGRRIIKKKKQKKT